MYFKWNNGNLVNIGWSDGEQLLCIQDSGDIFVYDMFGMHQHTFSMGAEARDTKVINCLLNTHVVKSLLYYIEFVFRSIRRKYFQVLTGLV